MERLSEYAYKEFVKMPARAWKTLVDRCLAIGSIATAIGVIVSIVIGVMSITYAEQSVRLSSEQLAHSRNAFLAFGKGEVVVELGNDDFFVSNEVELVNYGTSPAMNLRVQWFPTISDGSGDEFDTRGIPFDEWIISELDPFHLVPGKAVKLKKSNLIGLLKSGEKIREPKRWSGMVIVSWTGLDQERHFTKQIFDVKWLASPHNQSQEPKCSLTFGEVVKFGTQKRQ